jgi:hypothetical protein
MCQISEWNRRTIAAKLIGVLKELRHKMQVGNRGKEFRDNTKLSIGADLLEVRLGESSRVLLVIRTRTIDPDLRAAQVFDALLADEYPMEPLAFALESQGVAPDRVLVASLGNFDFDQYLGILACQ